MIVRWTGPAADLTHICDHTEKRFGAAQARRAAMAIYDAADARQDMPSVDGRDASQVPVNSRSRVSLS